MDFGRPLEKKDDLVARSNIQVLPEDAISTNSLDRALMRAANQASIDLFGSAEYNHTSFPEYTLYQSPTIQQGDLVVVFESFDNLSFVYAEHGKTFANRNGEFPHSSFIGMPWGSKIRSKTHDGVGYLYILKPTPELWARSLKHRTQIIHELDASQIILECWLKPNMRVVESGTGSGALSHAILRTIAPHGHLDTFEFHKERKETAQQEFENHNLSHLVTVHHQDVCGKSGQGGFGNVAQCSVDAVVLDLPEPWLAVAHAAYICKKGARIASYSPCVEQAQKCILALEEHGFHSVKTMEYRLCEYNIGDPVVFESPPCDLREGRREGDAAAMKQDDGDGEKQESSGEANDSKKRKRQDENATMLSNSNQMLCSRPFVSRGHTAFLTFATAGNTLRPDPRASLKEEESGDGSTDASR